MMSLVQASQVLGGELQGKDAVFQGVSTDTRSLQTGDLYFALRGERFDGHAFLDGARQAGAVGAVVDAYNDVQLPQIRVADTRKALGRLAEAWRQKFEGVVLAVTGSNGKTTVKEMIAAILAKQGEVLATRGNFNNDIGLPLTLLRMEGERFAVIEMGANHFGEIDVLTHITRPDVALITNAGPAHLEGFGSIEGVARGKGEIFAGLSEDGIALINADDDYRDYWMSLCKDRTVLRFGIDNPDAEIKGTWQAAPDGGLLNVTTPGGQVDIRLPLPGKHNAMNALAAIAASHAAGVSLDDAREALQSFRSVAGRLNVVNTATGMTVIDDTYNANPASLVAGIDVLMGLPGQHWLVLGDMGELGEDADTIHAQAGEQARRMGVDHLYAVGPASEQAVRSFGSNAEHFPSREALIGALSKRTGRDTNILVKGSRFMKMEQVVESLVGNER